MICSSYSSSGLLSFIPVARRRAMGAIFSVFSLRVYVSRRLLLDNGWILGVVCCSMWLFRMASFIPLHWFHKSGTRRKVGSEYPSHHLFFSCRRAEFQTSTHICFHFGLQRAEHYGIRWSNNFLSRFFARHFQLHISWSSRRTCISAELRDKHTIDSAKKQEKKSWIGSWQC